MTNLQTLIHLLRDSDRPAECVRLMDDAADSLSSLRKALVTLTDAVGKLPADMKTPGWGYVVAAMCGAKEILNERESLDRSLTDDYADAFSHFVSSMKDEVIPETEKVLRERAAMYHKMKDKPL